MEESFRQTDLLLMELWRVFCFLNKITVGVMLSGYKDREKGTFFSRVILSFLYPFFILLHKKGNIYLF